jgi:hypothetical protein
MLPTVNYELSCWNQRVPAEKENGCLVFMK